MPRKSSIARSIDKTISTKRTARHQHAAYKESLQTTARLAVLTNQPEIVIEAIKTAQRQSI